MEHHTIQAGAQEQQESRTTLLHAISKGESSVSAKRHQPVAQINEASITTQPVRRRGRRRLVPQLERIPLDDEFDSQLREAERTEQLQKRRAKALSEYPPEGYLGLPLGAFPDEESSKLLTRDRTDLLVKVDWEDGESFSDIVKTLEPTGHQLPKQRRTGHPIPTRSQDLDHLLGFDEGSAAQRYNRQRVEPYNHSKGFQPRRQGDQIGMKRTPTTGKAEDESVADEKEGEKAVHLRKRSKWSPSDARKAFQSESKVPRNSIMAAVDGTRSILAEERAAESGLIQEVLGPRKQRTTYQWPVYETLLPDPSKHAATSSTKPADSFEAKGIDFVDRLMGKPSMSTEGDLSSKDFQANKLRLAKMAKRQMAKTAALHTNESKSIVDAGTDETSKDAITSKKRPPRDTYPAGIIKVRTKIEDLSSLLARTLSKEEQLEQYKMDRHAAERAPRIHQVFEDEVVAFAQKMYRQGSALRAEKFDSLQKLTLPRHQVQGVGSSKPASNHNPQQASSATAQDTRDEEQNQTREDVGTDEALDELEWDDDELTALQEKAAVFSANDTMRRVLQRLPYVIRQGALGYKPRPVVGDFERRWETILLAADLGGVEERILKKVSMRMTNLLSAAQQLRYLAVRTKKPPSFEEQHQQVAEARENLKRARTHAILEMVRRTGSVDEFYETVGEPYKMDMYIKHLWEQEQLEQEDSLHPPPQQEESHDTSLPMQHDAPTRMGQLQQELVAADPLPGNDERGRLFTAEE